MSSSALPTHASAKQVRSRIPISSVYIFMAIIFCLLIFSSIGFSTLPSALLSSAQSLSSFHNFKGEVQSREKPTNSSRDSIVEHNSQTQNKTRDNSFVSVTDQDRQPQHHVETSTSSSPTTPNGNEENSDNQPTGTDITSYSGDNSEEEEPTSSENIGAFRSKFSKPPVGMKACGHMILFSAPRHGSTWFIDCVEKCLFSEANEGKSFGNLNFYSELWNPGQPGPLLNLSVDGAVEYLQKNASVKLFPSAVFQNRNDSIELTSRSYANGVPIVLLTRSPDAASKSNSIAKERGIWNTNLKRSAEEYEQSVRLKSTIKADPNFISRVTNHFRLVEEILREKDFAFDTVDYDDIKNLEYIELPINNCYVRNCT